MSARPGIADHLHEYFTDATELVDRIEQASRHLHSGDDQWACNLIALSTHTLSALSGECENLLKMFEAQGITPKHPDE